MWMIFLKIDPLIHIVHCVIHKMRKSGGFGVCINCDECLNMTYTAEGLKMCIQLIQLDGRGRMQFSGLQIADAGLCANERKMGTPPWTRIVQNGGICGAVFVY